MKFPQENKLFQRPCRSVLLPSYFFATTVVNEYDRSTFNIPGSLGHTSSRENTAMLVCDAKNRHVFKIEQCKMPAIQALAAVWPAM